MTDDDSALFQAALDSEGDEFLDTEEELRRSALPRDVLEPALYGEDPIARLMAQVLLDASEAETPQFDRADRYLATAEKWFARTVVGTPPVQGVVDNLSAQFGGSLAGYLALRLVKVPTAPVWRQRTTLAYLERNPTPAVTDALLRYASTTANPQLQATVARVLRSSGDSALAAKVATERERLARNGQRLPEPLAALG
jgi:hypothetical protein